MSAQRVRVVNVAQPTTGGAAACVRLLVAAGVRAGMDMILVCPDDGPLGPELSEAGATWEPLVMQRSPGVPDVAAALRLRTILSQADVVHLHSSKAGALGRMAVNRGRRGPGVAYTPHGWGWLVGGRLAPLYKRVERALAGRADAIVAVSEEDRQEGAAVLGRRADRLRVIPNGVDTERFSPDGPVAERRPDPLVVCVGRLSREKGQDLAIEALARLDAPDTRLRLVGDGPDRPSLEKLADRLGLGDRVEFTGFTDPSPHLRAADVVIVPSRWDAQSLSLLEAMSIGRPVVATAVAGVAALGDNGIVVTPGDAAVLADGVDRLLANADAGTAFGAATRRTVLARHRDDQMAEATMDLWRTLARRP